MEKWKQAARKFLDGCNFFEDIEVVFLTGSYVVGNADEYSDVDLYIILKEDVDWRERGNIMINGYLIEYFANPWRAVEAYIDRSHKQCGIAECKMITTGIILLDKHDLAKDYVNYCVDKMVEEFPKMEDFNIKMEHYRMWDHIDEMTRCFSEKSKDFTFQYYQFVMDTFKFYSRYLCAPIPGESHIYKWLTDKNYHENFGLPKYPDPIMLDLMMSMFESEQEEVMMNQALKLRDYVLNHTPDFNINNFVLRSSCAKQ